MIYGDTTRESSFLFPPCVALSENGIPGYMSDRKGGFKDSYYYVVFPWRAIESRAVAKAVKHFGKEPSICSR